VLLVVLALGGGDYFSNLTGYAAGLTLSFFLNRSWTFGDRTRLDPATVAKYLATFLVAYSVNLAIVAAARALGIVDNPLAHLAGVAAYTAIFYVGCRNVMYRDKTASAGSFIGTIIENRWPELATLACWVIAFVLLNNIAVSHDVVWQLWIARQILGGTGLYTQIMEVNPPLWFWMAVPVELLADWLGIPSRQAITMTALLLIGASLAILSRLVADQSVWRRATALLAAFAALAIIPIPDFLQREHLCLIGALPYIVLAARRADRKETSTSLAVAVVLMAAPAFALKHYFVLAPLFIEFWLAWKLRREWRPLRPETIGLVLGALVYGAAVLVYAPAFLTSIVPLVMTAYDDFAYPWYVLPAGYWVFVWALSATIIAIRRDALPSACAAAAVAAGAFVIAYFMQKKGWQYHALPAMGVMFFAVANLLPDQKWKRSEDIRIAGLLAALLIPVGFSLHSGPYLNERAAKIEPLIPDLGPGKAVAALTAHPSNMWPMVEDRGFVWSSRHFSYWMIYTIFDDENAAGARGAAVSELADRLRRETVEDFLCHPPEVIIVDAFRPSLRTGLDILRILNKSTDLRELLSHYRKGRTVAAYTAYRKDPDWNPEPPEGCRQIF
jgi:putative flippase GtrA